MFFATLALPKLGSFLLVDFRGPVMRHLVACIVETGTGSTMPAAFALVSEYYLPEPPDSSTSVWVIYSQRFFLYWLGVGCDEAGWSGSDGTCQGVESAGGCGVGWARWGVARIKEEK